MTTNNKSENPDKSGGGITGFAVKNHITVLALTVLLVLAGIQSFFTIPKQQDPGFIIRAAVITTVFPGANPARVEQLVTDRIEEVIQEIPELDYIESESRTGISIVTVHFLDKYKDMRPLFNKVRRKIDDLRDDGTLPSRIVGPTVNDEYGDVFGIIYTLQGDGFSNAELKEMADEIRNDLLSIKDVAKVEIHGEQQEVIYVEYNGARLQETGLTPTALSQALTSANILETGGDIRMGPERIVLEPTGNYETLAALGNTVISLPGSRGVIYLKDIATIFRGYNDPADSKVRHNGSPGLALAVSLMKGGDILALNERLDEAVPMIEASYPYGITLKKVFSQPRYVKKSVFNFMSNLGQSVAIVALVMFLFLGFRTGLIVACLVPTTILVTSASMPMFGITVNKISLAALIISLGLLVDNAIVMAEAIMIRRENGEDKFAAAIHAGNEMCIPLLTSSLTTAAAFLAMFLAENAAGEFSADIFKVVTISLLSSWCLSMTFIPIMTILLMKVKPQPHGGGLKKTPYSGILYRAYRRILFPSLRFKVLPIILVVILLIVSVWAMRFVPKVFIPGRKDPVINAKFNMPRGTDIAVTESVLSDLEARMLDRYPAEDNKSGVVDILSFIGVGTPRFVLGIDPDQEDSHRGAMIIQTTDPEVIPEIVKDVQDYAASKYPDLEVKMARLGNGPPIDYPIEVRVTGDDISTLYGIIGSIKTQLLSTSGVMDVSDDWGGRTKKLSINVNQDRARRAGVSNSDVALSLSTGISGLEMTEFREGNDIIPVTLRSVSSDRKDLSRLDGLTVYAQSGDAQVPLKQVADVELVWEDAIIKRRDRTRTIAVRTQHFPGVTASEVAACLTPWLEKEKESWPYGYTYEMGGEMETSEDAGKAIAAKLPLTGMIILLLLMAQFNNIRKTGIILFTIPLGLIGVSLGLNLAGTIFGFFTILGVISLAGIIINNAIVLIDRINVEREENGLSPSDAVIEACQQRLRPIMLTTATTVGGMLPLWVSHDPMFETMAVSIIFGLLFATLLTLVIVPVLYSILFRVKYENSGALTATSDN